jgi:hypothetical protein
VATPAAEFTDRAAAFRIQYQLRIRVPQHQDTVIAFGRHLHW